MDCEAVFERWFTTVKVGVDIDLDEDIGAHGESVLRVKFSNSTNKLMDDIYSRLKAFQAFSRNT